MRAHYITLETVRRAVIKATGVGVFQRQAALSSSRPHIHRSVWMPAEWHKQPRGIYVHSSAKQ
jgi:hypothetical protein